MTVCTLDLRMYGHKMTRSSLYSLEYSVADPRPPMQPTHHGQFDRELWPPPGRHRMPIPAIRFRVDFGRRQAVGPGKIALLERIGQTGSLSQAARGPHMSYPRARPPPPGLQPALPAPG